MIENKERTSEEKGKSKNYEKRKFRIFAKKSLGVMGTFICEIIFSNRKSYQKCEIR